MKKIFPISMAVLWGIIFATAIHNWVIGICLGIMWGSVFDLFGSDEKDGVDEQSHEGRQ